MAKIGPVVLSVAGDEFVQPARIQSILWSGKTIAGDTVLLTSRVGAHILWEGRTDTTNTHIPQEFGPEGIHAPDGFKLAQISGGKLLVYLREN